MESKRLTLKNRAVRGEIEVPGDKSISHRAVIFGSIAEGETVITHFLEGEDCLATIDCFKKMGVSITKNSDSVIVKGKGLKGLKEPAEQLDVGNSGTTIRLLLGLLAARPHVSRLKGDASIAKRPMNRVVEPLRQMGAVINGRENGNYTPLEITGKPLKGISYTLPIASAQVKSAILLAGLQAEGKTTIIEKAQTRDHTERMIRSFGGNIEVSDEQITIMGNQRLTGRNIAVPGDISSAAFWMVAGAIVPNSEVILHHVGLNPTRTGIVDVLRAMGADIEVILDNKGTMDEERGTVIVRSSRLKGITIEGELIPRLIDEIPIIALLATQADGETVIRDAAELKVKETNRIDAVATQLGKLGAHIEPTEDGLIIRGKTTLHGGLVDSLGDHRIGMTLAIASLISESEVELIDPDAISVSYPGFFDDLNKLAVSQKES